MSEISNCNVFTNDAVSVGSDLLQQAFQQVVDDEDRENEFVAFLQSDDIDSQTIHLTPEQALALGLTFEVSSAEEVMYQQSPDNAVTDITESLTVNNNIKSQKQNSLSSQGPITIAQINFANDEMQKSSTTDSSVMKDECIDFQEWHVEKLPHNEKLEKQMLGTELSLDEISLCNENHTSQMTTEQQNNCIQQNSATLLMEPKIHTIKVDGHGKNLNRNDISVQEVLAQDDQLNNITDSQAQILQKLPMILPSSSQFIIKPAQTILKPGKNIKVLQGSNKFANSTINTINGHANSNPVLFSKATILNTLSPQIIKATPITTQLINSSGISTQFLNTSQILTGNCDIANHVSTPHISGTVINTTPGSVQNLVTQQIRLAPVVKTSQSALQRGNVQQLLTPLIKNSAAVMSKQSQVINNNNLTTISPQLLKSVPGQILRTAATSVGKKPLGASTISKTSINSNSPVVIRTASIIKTPDLKTVTSNPTSILKPAQISSTPISILKPQMKITLNNTSKQNLIVTSQNISNSTNTLSNTSQKIPVTQRNDTFETITNKTTQNDSAKQKLNFAVNGTYLKVNKKSRNASAQPATIITESTDTSKPLGSSENPIQIVQQGQTFHSMQRLSHTQLKQISQVLQQRNQEAAMSNERVVYRVVFPEELDLRIRSPGNLLKNRGGKRGRPKKNAIRPSVFPLKSSPSAPAPPPPPPLPLSSVADDEQEELKDERKKVVARTRSGRLSRPPRHMVRDYKHLHHLDFSQPDLDDSDGGYSDYNTNNDKLEDEECPKELLTGLEVPKRKISDHFRCPTCNKIYLGRSRMARHFETHPDHGSPEQLPPPTREPELKQSNNQDPLKRKGKRRGPWAYVTPEAKSERRQVKLKEALAVCENVEIIKIAAKPVLNAQSLFDLLMLKSDYDVKTFLNELKILMSKIREKTSIMLTIVDNDEKQSKDLIEINEELLCDALGINPGLYRMNNEALKNIELPISSNYKNNVTEQPPLKIQKTNIEDRKENNEEQMSSGFSESSDLSVSDFLNDRRNDTLTNPTCPEVLSALTLMRKNPSPVNNADTNKLNNVSKLLISNPEIQSQISDNPGFQKVDINTSKVTNFEKSHKEGFIKLVDSVGLPNCAQIFCKMENKYEQSKLDQMEQSFIKLEPVDQGFVKLENGTAVGAYQKQESLEKIRDGLDNVETGSQSFTKGFQRLVSKIVPMTSAESSLNCIKTQSSPLETESCKVMPSTSVCKISDSIPMLQESVPIISSNCDGNIFENTDNLDMSKMTQYDHIAHLDILNTSGVIDKNLLIDEKLVEQLHLVDQSNLVDELVSERLKNIIPDNILENNLISNNANLDTDLDFEVLREEFGNNTRS